MPGVTFPRLLNTGPDVVLQRNQIMDQRAA